MVSINAVLINYMFYDHQTIEFLLNFVWFKIDIFGSMFRNISCIHLSKKSFKGLNFCLLSYFICLFCLTLHAFCLFFVYFISTFYLDFRRRCMMLFMEMEEEGVDPLQWDLEDKAIPTKVCYVFYFSYFLRFVCVVL